MRLRFSIALSTSLFVSALTLWAQPIINNIEFGGASLVAISDRTTGIIPFGSDKMYRLALVAHLSTSIIAVTDGYLTKAMASTGTDLVNGEPRNHRIHFPKLSKDHNAIVFEVKLSDLDKKILGFVELTGTLNGFLGSEPKIFDVGIHDFVPGSTGQLFGAVIDNIADSEYDDGKVALSLRLKLHWKSIKAINVYGTDSNDVIGEMGGTRYSADDASPEATFELLANEFPPSGRILVEVYPDFKKAIIPFSVTNITLLGRPLHAEHAP